MKVDNLDGLSIENLWALYGSIHDKLKELGQIRSRNITGDRGEQLAIETYNRTKNLPKLQMAPPSTKNIDAISARGERYSIKTITLPNKTTGVFHGYGTPDKPIKEKKFEYLIIVVVNAYQPELVIELTWEDFFELKKWHSTMRAFNISLTKTVLEKSKIIFEKSSKSEEVASLS